MAVRNPTAYTWVDDQALEATRPVLSSVGGDIVNNQVFCLDQAQPVLIVPAGFSENNNAYTYKRTWYVRVKDMCDVDTGSNYVAGTNLLTCDVFMLCRNFDGVSNGDAQLRSSSYAAGNSSGTVNVSAGTVAYTWFQGDTIDLLTNDTEESIELWMRNNGDANDTSVLAILVVAKET